MQINANLIFRYYGCVVLTPDQWPLQAPSVKEVGHVQPQAVGDQQEMAQLHLSAGFHALDCRPVEFGRVGEAFLGEVEVQPSYSDAVSGGPAGVEDPLGLVGWHPPHATVIMVLSQQQNCRFIRS